MVTCSFLRCSLCRTSLCDQITDRSWKRGWNSNLNYKATISLAYIIDALRKPSSVVFSWFIVLKRYKGQKALTSIKPSISIRMKIVLVTGIRITWRLLRRKWYPLFTLQPEAENPKVSSRSKTKTRRPASTGIFFAQLQIFWSIFANG